MARKIKFSLMMKDGYKVENDLAELREHFDLECVIDYFHRGKLQRWLKNNNYCEEAEKIEVLREDKTFVRDLCRILNVEVPVARTGKVNMDIIKDKSSRLHRLKQYTSDSEILALAEQAAFSQDDLDSLIAEGAKEILLCDARLEIPLHAGGVKYYGVGKVVAVIKSEKSVDFVARQIEFHNVEFDEDYQRLVDNAQKPLKEEEAKRRQEILAEILGIVMHGKLSTGETIWTWPTVVDVADITYKPWDKARSEGFIAKSGGKIPDATRFAKDEKIIGGIVLQPHNKKEEGKTKWAPLALMALPFIPGVGWIASAVSIAAGAGLIALFESGDVPISMVFTDQAVYFDAVCIPYVLIENVVIVQGAENCMVVRIRLVGEKNLIDLPLMKYKSIEVEAVQLFLLAVMNFYGEHKRELTQREKERFKKITLVSLKEACLLDFLS